MEDLKISLAAARVNAKMTQEEVAKAINKSKNTIVNWENGKTMPDTPALTMLASLYNISIDNIFLP